jgi:type VI secretion system protein VasD
MLASPVLFIQTPLLDKDFGASCAQSIKSRFNLLQEIVAKIAAGHHSRPTMPLNGRFTPINLKLQHRPTMTATALRRMLLLGLIALAGCAGGTSIAGAALEATGLRKPAEAVDAQKPPRNIALKLHAGAGLNADVKGNPLALVARIYKLRQSAAFEQAPYDTFLDASKEKEAFGADLLEVKEVILIPGQHYEVSEKVSRDAAFVGVVALFHSPSPQRWRLAFSSAEAEKTGITIGVHGCALSVGASTTPARLGATMRSPAHCQ